MCLDFNESVLKHIDFDLNWIGWSWIEYWWFNLKLNGLIWIELQGTGQYLTDLTDKLNEFVKQVDSLEDWELPVVSTIESSNFMQGNLNDVASKLMVRLISFLRYFDHHNTVILDGKMVKSSGDEGEQDFIDSVRTWTECSSLQNTLYMIVCQTNMI